MRLEAVIAVRRRVDERHHRRRMIENALREGEARRREAILRGLVEEQVPTRFAVDEADVEMAAAAGAMAPGLRHEGGVVAEPVGHFLDRVLEQERLVGAGEVLARAVVDLELRGRVFAVVGDEVDAGVLQMPQQLVDLRHPLVAHAVEDMHAFEQRLVTVLSEEIELELMAHHDVETEPVRLADETRQHPAGRGLDRLAAHMRIAHHARRRIEPRHRPERGPVRKQLAIGVVHLLVELGAADHAGGRIERERSAIHVEALAGIALDLVGRHQLEAGNAVHVRQLEAEKTDLLLLQSLDLPADLVSHGSPLSRGRAFSQSRIAGENSHAESRSATTGVLVPPAPCRIVVDPFGRSGERCGSRTRAC